MRLNKKYQQKGITTHQIVTAPLNALYFWGTNDVRYPKAIALKENRTDLTFIGPSWLTDGRWQSLSLTTHLVVDHAVELSTEQNQILWTVRDRLAFVENQDETH